jgi:predicted dehydrogenase
MVGTSWYADWMHLPVLKSHSQVQIAAICGRNKARADELAVKYGIPHVDTDFHEMMTQKLLDAVVIAVPDDQHYPIATAALDAGLNVLCEKPLAFTLDQARDMLVKAEAAQVKHMTYFTWRWAPYVRLAQKLVREGFIGECYDAQFDYLGGYAYGGTYQWKWDRQRGRGVLGDLGSQMIDMAHLLVGDIARVQAQLSTRVLKPHPDGISYDLANDSANLTIQFKNGATGRIITSAVVEMGNRQQLQRIQLFGSNGTLEISADGLGNTVRGLRRNESEYQTFPIPAEFLEGSTPNASVWDEVMQLFTHQSIGTRLFIDSILQDSSFVPSFVEGVKVQAVIEAAFRSDQSGCWVDVD